MDIEKLIEQLNARGLSNGSSLGYHCGLYDEASTALSTLQAENSQQKADWAKRWPACGLYGKAVPQQMISDTAKQIFSRIGIRYDDWEFQVEGQISMERLEEALKDGN